MSNLKRQICLTEIKNGFSQSGFVDWHLNIRTNMQDENHEEEGDTVVQTAPPEFKRPKPCSATKTIILSAASRTTVTRLRPIQIQKAPTQALQIP